MDLVDPFDNTMKNSLFFRVNVSGRIESANVMIFFNLLLTNKNKYISIKNSFMTGMRFSANMTLSMEMTGREKMGKYPVRVNIPVEEKDQWTILFGICHLNAHLDP